MDSPLDASLSLHLGPAPTAAPAKVVCVHCQQAVSVPELRLAIQCGRPRCGQSAHALCAVEQGYAGVLEQLGLDGQYLCRLCGAKSDLLPYWQERLAAAAAGEGLALGQHLGLAARLLHKTRRPEVEGVQAQVEYAVAQLVAGQDAGIIAKLLRQLAADASRVVLGAHPPAISGSGPASPPWPHSDPASSCQLSFGGSGKVERDLLVGLRTAPSVQERLRPPEGGVVGTQATLTLGRTEGGQGRGVARPAQDGHAGGGPAGGDTGIAAAEHLAHLTRTLQVAVEEATVEAGRLKVQAEADLRRAHTAREEATAHEVAARRAGEAASAQEAVARAAIGAAQRAQEHVQQMRARGEAHLEALKQELQGGGYKASGLKAPSEATPLPFTQASKGPSPAPGGADTFGEQLETSLRGQLKVAQMLDNVRAMDSKRGEERRRGDQLRFKRGQSEGTEEAAERGGGAGLLAALRGDSPGKGRADTFLMLSSGGVGSPHQPKRVRLSGAGEEGGGSGGSAVKVKRSASEVVRISAEEGANGKEQEKGALGLTEARDFLIEPNGEGGGRSKVGDGVGDGEAALAAERSIKDAELVLRAELAVLQNRMPSLARQFGERKIRVLVLAALARQYGDTWRLCLMRRKGKGFRLQLPMCGLDAGLDLLGVDSPDTLPLARKLARDSLGDRVGDAAVSSPSGYSEPVRYTEEHKDGSVSVALIHPLIVSRAEGDEEGEGDTGTSYQHGDTYVTWNRVDALVPMVRDVPQKFSATFPRVLKCLELLMTHPMDGWPLPPLLKQGGQPLDGLT